MNLRNLRSRTFGLPKSLHAFGVNVVLLPLGIANSILIARTVGPSGKGALDLIVASSALLVMFLSLSLPPGITYVVAQQGVRVGVLASQLLGIALVQGSLAFLVLWALRVTGHAAFLVPEAFGIGLFAALALFIVVELLSRFWGAILTGRGEIAVVNNSELIGRAAQFFILFGVVGVLYWRGEAVSVIWLFAVLFTVSALINVMLFSALKTRFEAPTQFGALKEALRFALPCYLANSAQFLNYRLDVFIVGYFAGFASVGRYTLAVSLGQLLWLMSNSVASVLLPKVAASTDLEESVRHTSRVNRLALLASLVCGIALGLFATQAIPVFYGESFRPSVTALLLLLPGIIVFSSANVLAAYLAGIGKPRLNLLVSCVSLVVTILLDLTLIPRLGIVGASIASTASYTVAAVMLVVLFTRETGASVRQVLLPSLADLKFVMTLARPMLVRARLQRA